MAQPRKGRRVYNNSPYIVRKDEKQEQSASWKHSSGRFGSEVGAKQPNNQSDRLVNQKNTSKMSRLDELLSRNDIIYQNLRSQLQQISQSNRNIDLNLHNIKPFSNSHRMLNSDEGEPQDLMHGEMEPSFSQASFKAHEQSKPQGKIVQISQDHNYRYYYPIQKEKEKKYSDTSIPSEGGRPNQVTAQLTEDFKDKLSKYIEYEERDSSPVESEFHMMSTEIHPGYEGSRRINFQDDSHQHDARQNARRQQDIMMKKQRPSALTEEHRPRYKDNSVYTDPQVYRQSEPNQLIPDSRFRQRVNTSMPAPYGQYSEQTFEERLGETNHNENSCEVCIDGDVGPHDINLEDYSWTSKSHMFIPFNKIYNSPIMELAGNDQVIISRKYKSGGKPSKTNGRILNGIKYRYPTGTLVLEENKLFAIFKSYLIERGHGILDLQYEYSTKAEYLNIRPFSFGIIGGENCSKKKLHVGMIAHAYSYFLDKIANFPSKSFLALRIEHQEAATNATPIMHSYLANLTDNPVENQISLSNTEALLEKIFLSMRAHLVGESAGSYRVRVTRMELLDTRKRIPVCDVKIVSTNKVDEQFVRSLGLSAICWCINPLFKHHDSSLSTLAAERKHRSKFAPNNSDTLSRTFRKEVHP